MDISIFLAQVFGFYFVISGAAILMRPQMLTTFIRKLNTPEFIYASGFVSLLAGAPLVLLHTVWDGTWHVVVTVVVWLILFKGVMRLFAPELVVEWSRAFVRNEKWVQITIWLMVAVGAYLLYVGFVEIH